MLTRRDLLLSKEYWLARTQSSLYSMVESYMEQNNLNRTELAKKLGVSKGYISQVLNGNFDHRLSKFIELSLAIKKIPTVHFEDIDQILDDDAMGLLYEDDNLKRPVIKLDVKFSPATQQIDVGQHRKYVNTDDTLLDKKYQTVSREVTITESEALS